MSGSRTPLVIAAVVGGAGLLAVGMAATLGLVWYLVPHTPSREIKGTPEPVAAEPVEEAEPEPEPEPVLEEAVETEPENVPEPEMEPAEAPAPPGLAPAAPTRAECTPNSRGITQLGARKWRVKRSVIERYTSDLDAAGRLASVKWAKTRSGKNRGVRLTRVPCKSPLRAAGLRSKDLILEVDGKAVTSMAQGLRIWASIRRKSSFRVKLRRKNATVVHTYVLQK